MAEWTVPSMWQGATCFILGGGPSVLTQFNVPEKVREQLRNPKQGHSSLLSPYLEPIHDKKVIGVNNAYQIGDWIDVLFFGDCSWYLYHKKKLAAWPGLKVSCCPRFANRPKNDPEGIKYLYKDRGHTSGVSKNKKKVSWNKNSGAAAINLAVHLGVKRIVLLGFDMKLDEDSKQWWHSGHHHVPRKQGDNRKPKPFKRHLTGFPAIKRDTDELGVEILNANPESKIDVFPKVDIKDYLNVK